MPYDTFVKAQIAGDLMESGKDKELAVGLGFYGLSPELTDDRVDVTTRGFLALTAACAQCHDHKFDPIPTRDYYALQGVFSSTKRTEFDLDPPDVVEHFKAQEKRVKEWKPVSSSFFTSRPRNLAEILALSRRVTSCRAPSRRPRLRDPGESRAGCNLDLVTLERWVRYLKAGPRKQHT